LLFWIRRHPLAAYFILTCAITWTFWIPRAVSGAVVRPGAALTYLLGLLGPMLAAIMVTGLAYGRAGVRDLLRRTVSLRAGVGWLIFSAASPIVAYLVTVVTLRLAGAPWPHWADLGRFGGQPELGVPLVWLSIVLVNGFGEEVGWRGFALPHLRQELSLLRAALFLAVPWAIWHIPAFFFVETYRGISPLMLPGFFMGLAAGSIVLAWLYERTSSSILAVALWHGSYNLVSATLAARGVPAAVISTAVIIWAIVIAIQELRRNKRCA
jgi:membrane protease YdiL (CAAX protease family)